MSTTTAASAASPPPSALLKGSGVRVTTVMPGPVNTTILRSEADRADLPQPEDIAATVRYALSLPTRVEVQEVLITPTPGRA